MTFTVLESKSILAYLFDDERKERIKGKGSRNGLHDKEICRNMTALPWQVVDSLIVLQFSENCDGDTEYGPHEIPIWGVFVCL